MTVTLAMNPVDGAGRSTITAAMPGEPTENLSSTESFYANLPVFADFADVALPDKYMNLPDDWHVAVADIEGSTAAVRAGRYKDVNLLGASCIISVLNATQPVEIPYVFGGDGASLCVPASQLDAAKRALLATQRLARTEFELRLRVGIVPVTAIQKAGYHVSVAKFRASNDYNQASFTGGGVMFAERCVKDEADGREFRLEAGADSGGGNFSGLECRWDNIPSPHGEIVTLLVEATTNNAKTDAAVYAEVIRTIDGIYGLGGALAPIREADLHLTHERAKLIGEAKIHAAGKGRWRQTLYAVWAQIQSAFGGVLLARGLKFRGIDWGKYRQDVIANTDYRKFDDVLRYVLSGTPAQRERLCAALEQKYRSGLLVYGVHHAPTALMTCLIFSRDGGHVHFVDGADGGYTMAAADLKQRLSCAMPQTG